MRRSSYDSLLNRGDRSFCNFYIKDGVLYYNKGNNPDDSKPIEVIGVREITRNTRLVQLEVRFRIDGALKSDRIKGSEDELLSIMDRLGYGG